MRASGAPGTNHRQGCLHAWPESILRHGGLSVATLARSEGMSERQLLRLFDSELGVGPKAFSRVVRFQHALAGLFASNGDRALNLALDAGYYDQAHFIHDFRALCGVTPASLLR